MVEGFITNSDKLEFRQIVLGHLKKILELSCIEFHGGYYRAVSNGQSTTQEYVPDSRKGYTQGVENLAIVLLPYFDKTMQGDYNKYKTGITELVKELGGTKTGNIYLFNAEKKHNIIFDRSN